jgi:N-acyl-D-glutamate deacylase/dihydroorotase
MSRWTFTNADYVDPYQASTGIHHILVTGQQVVKDSVHLEQVYAGKKLLNN